MVNTSDCSIPKSALPRDKFNSTLDFGTGGGVHEGLLSKIKYLVRATLQMNLVLQTAMSLTC